MANKVIVPISGPRIGAPSVNINPGGAGKVQAKLTSLDSGVSLTFLIPPSEHDRDFGANWEDAGVAQAAIQFSEYKDSPPEVRVYKVTLDGYRQPGGINNNIEGDYAKLKLMTLRVKGVRPPRLLFSQGLQQFKCVLTRVGMPVRRIARDGGALQSIETQITLREIR